MTFNPGADGQTAGQGALAGVRVVDFTQVLSGPYCTQILGDLGADIIKIESPQGDVARTMPPNFVADSSVYYLSINRNKRSIVLDLKRPEGLDLARRLVEASDVVIENFRPGVLPRLGLSAEAARQQNPRLIWCSVSGFGQDGPYRDKQAYDLIVQALSGGMSLTGEREGASVRAGIPIADLAAGLYAAIGILAALNRVHATGRGETIDVSMLDCQAAMLCYQAANYLHSGRVPGRQGRGHDSVASYDTFEAADGVEVVVAAMTDSMWISLCRAIGREDVLADERFRTNATRHANRAAVHALLRQAFLERPAEEWVAALEREGVPAGAVNTIDRVAADPQIRHRGMVFELAAGDGRRVRVMGDPLFMAESRRAQYGYPPAAGENSTEVLGEVLGLSADEIARLTEAGVVRVRAATGDRPAEGTATG
jgi:crotonobetainyl-CoA:carnitine CoA-transferase CaiB-like acyl-CoA transferase